MAEPLKLTYIIKTRAELNLSYMPFIVDGGIFIPTTETFNLGDLINLEIQIPEMANPLRIDGKVIWITPKNALYHTHQGIGVEFKGINAKAVRDEIVANLDDTMDVGGYTSGILPKVPT